MAIAKKPALRLYELFERIVVVILLVLLMIVVLWATSALTIDLLGRLVARLRGEPRVEHFQGAFFGRQEVLREVFGGFLLILIGIELMKTVVMYLEEKVLHVEVVFAVAMIAAARHVIDLNFEEENPLVLLGVGVVIVALSIGFYFFKRAMTLDAAMTAELAARHEAEESKP